MQSSSLPVDRDEVNYFFVTAAFKHKNRYYKVALAETVTYDGEVTGGYDVLLQSEDGTFHYQIYKDVEGNWTSDDHLAVQQEINYLLGKEIEKLRP